MKGEEEEQYLLRPVVQGKDRLVDVDLVAKGVWEGRPLCNGRCDGGLEEVDEEAEEAEEREQSKKDGGLIERYTQAMQDQPSTTGNINDEASFLRYLRTANG